MAETIIEPELESLSIKVEFTGGLEALFNKQRQHTILLPLAEKTSPVPTQWTLDGLIEFLRSTFLADNPRQDLFVMHGTVRPGILVLVNDADWALLGEGGYVLQKGDEVMFMSTLHGG